jgi:hypothetical protein
MNIFICKKIKLLLAILLEVELKLDSVLIIVLLKEIGISLI